MAETKPLSALQERAAFMVADGKNYAEIAEILDRSENWVARSAMLPEFKAKVAEFESTIKDELKKQASQGLPEIEAFKAKLKSSSEQIYAVGSKLLEKVSAAVEALESEEISVNRLPSLLKSATDALVCSIEMQKFVLGIDRLIEELQEVQKLAEINRK